MPPACFLGPLAGAPLTGGNTVNASFLLGWLIPILWATAPWAAPTQDAATQEVTAAAVQQKVTELQRQIEALETKGACIAEVPEPAGMVCAMRIEVLMDAGTRWNVSLHSSDIVIVSAEGCIVSGDRT